MMKIIHYDFKILNAWRNNEEKICQRLRMVASREQDHVSNFYGLFILFFFPLYYYNFQALHKEHYLGLKVGIKIPFK